MTTPSAEPGARDEALVKIACIQMEPVIGERDRNVRRSLDRVERGQQFLGQSLIASDTGWPIGGPASLDTEEIICADANLADARRMRNWNEYNQVLRDRRVDVYGEMLGAPAARGSY